MEKKFDFNQDVIIYQNMMNEFEILKNIILDKELVEIMKFVSKTSISLNSEIQINRNKEFENLDIKYEYNLCDILDNFPELIKKYENNPYIYSKMIQILKNKMNK